MHAREHTSARNASSGNKSRKFISASNDFQCARLFSKCGHVGYFFSMHSGHMVVRFNISKYSSPDVLLRLTRICMHSESSFPGEDRTKKDRFGTII